MKRVAATVTALLIMYTLHGQQTHSTNTFIAPIIEEVLHPSLIQLIATPEKYDGREIQVIGYLHLEFEGDRLYLHKEDCNHLLTYNGISLKFSDNQIQNKNPRVYSNKYVIISGRFKVCSNCLRSNGILGEIDRLDFWE